MGLVIGLLGGVASGKSTAARAMGRRGLLVVDADALARETVGEPAVAARLAQRFGADLFDAGGRLDRALLARRAFADAEATAALNAIVHPRVRERIGQLLAAAGARAVVLDVPLLLESPLADLVDTWVFVRASEEAREQRARERSWPAGERARREAQQADLGAKRERAGHVLENDGSIEDLERRVDALLRELGIPVASGDARDPRP